MQVERRTGTVRRPKTDVLPLCHATNSVGSRSITPFFTQITAMLFAFLQDARNTDHKAPNVSGQLPVICTYYVIISEQTGPCSCIALAVLRSSVGPASARTRKTGRWKWRCSLCSRSWEGYSHITDRTSAFLRRCLSYTSSRWFLHRMVIDAYGKSTKKNYSHCAQGCNQEFVLGGYKFWPVSAVWQWQWQRFLLKIRAI